jgi:hypothetical protein
MFCRAGKNTTLVSMFVHPNRPCITRSTCEYFPNERANAECGAGLASTVEATLYHDVISTTDSANIEVALQNHCGAAHGVISKGFVRFFRGIHG